MISRLRAHAGVEPLASRAIAARQDWAWRRGVEMGDARTETDLATLLDALAATRGNAA